jgi:hypothetical protein
MGWRRRGAVVALWLACWGLPQVAQAGLFGDEKLESVLIEPLPTVTVRYPAFGPDQVVHRGADLVSKLLQEMVRSTKTKTVSRSEGDFDYVMRVEGKVVPGRSQLVLTYLNRQTMRRTKTFIGQSLAIPVNYQVQETADAVEVTLSVAEAAELQTSTALLYGTPGIRQDVIFRDFAAILANAPQLRLPLFVPVKGEATSAYKPEAVRASFERLMGRMPSWLPSSRGDSTKLEGVYAFLAGAVRMPVSVAVYPYREGSKVTYEAQVPYFVRGDQSAEGLDLPARLKATVDKVMSD